MKRPIFILLILLTLTVISAAGYITLSAPQKLESALSETLRSAGFEKIALPTPTTKLGQANYQNIALGPDGFSTLESLTLTYNPFKLALFERIESAHIKGLDLTGEIAPQKQITIAGWKHPPQGTLTKLLGLSKAAYIELENARLSLLSEQSGGITIELSAQLRPSGNITAIQGRIKATQRQLSAAASLEGQLTDEGFWDIRMELEHGKFTLPGLRATRLAGLLNLSGQNLYQARLLGELEAGGLNVAGMPWQNGALTLDGTVHEPRMILGAKSTGIDGLELGLTIPNMRAPSVFTGTLHAGQLSNAFDYLDKQNKLLVPRASLTALEKIENIDITFSKQDSLIFNIKNEEQKIDIKGNIASKNKEKQNGTIQAALLSLASLTSNPKALGAVNLQGEFSAENDALAGNLQFEISAGSVLPYGPIPLTLEKSQLTLTDWQKLAGPPVKDRNCQLRSLKANHSCTLSMRIHHGQIKPSALKLDIAGIKLSVPGAAKEAAGKPAKTLIKIDEADIGDLFGALKKRGWNAAGYLTGTAALTEENGKTIINNLHLTNKGVGILKLTDTKLFDMMEMEELEKETMKLALENFHYDTLEIKASGALPDDVTISVFGKGKNPGLMQGRAFSLDFKVKPDFAPLIATLFETKID